MPEFAADAWSTGLVFFELTTLYEAFSEGRPSPLVEPTLQFGDVADWHRQRLSGIDGEAFRGFWHDELADAPPVALPSEDQLPVPATISGARHPLTLTAPLADAIRTLGRRERMPVFGT